MRATIEFDLPDESYEHLRTLHGREAFRVLEAIDEKLRQILKHGIDREPQSVYEEIREEIHDVLRLVND